MMDIDQLFSADEFRRRVYRDGEGVAEAETISGDHILNPSIDLSQSGIKFKDAAVLVPIVDYGSEARVILTQRTVKLRKHSGQIAFPGGGIDDEDKTPEAAALREAYEEIGLEPRFVETIGRMPQYLTGTAFRITPVLSIVKPGFSLQPNPDEVDEIFEVPLSFLMDEHNFQRGSRVLQGNERFFYEIHYGNRNIWGITAGIIRLIYERFYR
jgi:8-oxo-dGTP pyrophosphatase MutT (NUDIX family)